MTIKFLEIIHPADDMRFEMRLNIYLAKLHCAVYNQHDLKAIVLGSN